VGAGTGVFAAAWPRWALAKVVAVEPSTTMAREADDSDPAVSFVGGVAEALPLRGAGADVIWVSTALHHFPDVHAAVAEFRRVLRRAGVVLVRTYLPGRTEVTWVDAFPGRPKWEARFHTEDQLKGIFGAHGFALTDVIEVLEWSETYGESADWAESMRDADSMLTALTDDEIAQGLAVLRSRPDEMGRLELTLLVFEKALP
jgi:SAM-dependent methyltransferase